MGVGERRRCQQKAPPQAGHAHPIGQVVSVRIDHDVDVTLSCLQRSTLGLYKDPRPADKWPGSIPPDSHSARDARQRAMIRLTYQPASNWPTLAWLARLPAAGQRQSHDAQEVVVTHGQRVEARPDWFGEIVWAGDLDEAAFDRTDLVFGSGARVRGTGGGASELVFVPAGTTVDRLQWIEAGGYLWISNSLACLLAQVAGELDPADGGWFDRLGSITRGIDGYERELPTSAGTVRLH